MATAHLSVKVGKSGKGVPHAEYISRVGKYEKKLDGNEQLEATESGTVGARQSPTLLARSRPIRAQERHSLPRA